jgi:hypothetical protein
VSCSDVRPFENVCHLGHVLIVRGQVAGKPILINDLTRRLHAGSFYGVMKIFARFVEKLLFLGIQIISELWGPSTSMPWD